MQEWTATSKCSEPIAGFEDDGIVLRVDLHIASSVNLIDGLVDSIAELIQVTALRENIEQIELALREAMSNAIIHGNGEDPAKSVAVQVVVTSSGRVRMSVKDQGKGFDPSLIANPTHQNNKLQPSGRGVFLMGQLMDEVSFRFGEGTEVVMQRESDSN